MPFNPGKWLDSKRHPSEWRWTQEGVVGKGGVHGETTAKEDEDEASQVDWVHSAPNQLGSRVETGSQTHTHHETRLFRGELSRPLENDP